MKPLFGVGFKEKPNGTPSCCGTRPIEGLGQEPPASPKGRWKRPEVGSERGILEAYSERFRWSEERYGGGGGETDVR